jgi:hypothetical protein
VIPVSVVDAASVVTFPDANLEAAVRDAIGIPTGDIYDDNLTALTELFADSLGIVDITGLEYCTGLMYLGLGHNQIGDNITPLSGLTNLMYLDLASNETGDLSLLSGLGGLQGLILASNSISDISSLSGLSGLMYLDLQSNLIGDNVSPLSGLTNLMYLYLQSNGITDIEPLVNNTGISSGDEVDISDNPLSATSIDTYIPELQGRGATVYFDGQSNQAPYQPSNVSPADGATGISLTGTAQSSAFSDPDAGDTHAASQWQMTTTAGTTPVWSGTAVLTLRI